MQPIDQPFRFTLNFVVVWGLLAVATQFIIPQDMELPWFSEAGKVIVVSLYATFVLYGPVVVARRIFSSGSRGWFVARVLLSILLVGVLLFGGLWLSGYYSEAGARAFAFLFLAFANTYLHWKLEKSTPSQTLQQRPPRSRFLH